jgi:hypothetical protein
MRRTWVVLAAAFILGLAGGLYYAWVVNPVEYVDSAPDSFREPYRQNYLILIASAYAQTGDLARARARLSLFHDPQIRDTLAALAQRELARGGSEREAQALAALAARINETASPASNQTPATSVGTVIASATLREATFTPTPTPTPRRTPRRTSTPTATPGAPFELSSRQTICDPKAAAPLIEVVVLDAASKPVPGVEVLIVWDNGQDHFYTGLKPELGLGYGDFTMTEGVTYTVQLKDSPNPVTGVSSEGCTADDGTSFPGSIELTFTQPER